MITTCQHGPIRELRLSRPPANALSPDLIAALKHAVETAPRDGVRAIVLSGTPGWFSGGLDVPLLLTLDRAAMAGIWRDFYGLLRALACSPIPIVAAITGHAPAGGTVLSLFCDWRVVAEGDWRIGLNEVQVGLALPPTIFQALKFLVGPHQAERLAVSGVLISPAEAARIGLLDETVPPERVVPRAVEWCQGMLALPPQAMMATRVQARADLVALFNETSDHEPDEVLAMWCSPETQTVLRALVEQLGKKRNQAASPSHS